VLAWRWKHNISLCRNVEHTHTMGQASKTAANFIAEEYCADRLTQDAVFSIQITYYFAT